eukprot:363592-Chlamydomonas_euryale.AAC.7
MAHTARPTGNACMRQGLACGTWHGIPQGSLKFALQPNLSYRKEDERTARHFPLHVPLCRVKHHRRTRGEGERWSRL